MVTNIRNIMLYVLNRKRAAKISGFTVSHLLLIILDGR